jgi:hypothetical protein
LICDEIDLYWYKLTPEEQKEAQQYSVELQSQWPLRLQYKQAVRVLEGWSETWSKSGKDYWENKLAEIKAAMEKENV